MWGSTVLPDRVARALGVGLLAIGLAMPWTWQALLRGHRPPPPAGPLRPELVELPGGTLAMARTEVTQAQVAQVLGERPSYFTGDDRPVEKVTWYDAVRYCNALTKLEQALGQRGLTLCYEGEGQGVIWKQECTGYRLPTEAEWEQAARAGQGDRFAGDDGKNDAKDYAWFDEGTNGQTHPVKTKQPNAWGLYDMSGNVWEWVWDKYDASGSDRVLRGGSFWYSAGRLRASARDRLLPGGRSLDLGFRVARSLPSSL